MPSSLSIPLHVASVESVADDTWRRRNSIKFSEARRLLGGDTFRCRTATSEKVTSFRPKRGRKRAAPKVRALDAAMPFDYEAIQRHRLESQKRLKIGIIGFGNFGQFLAKRILKYNHEVIAYSRSDYSAEARALGINYFRDADDFCEQHPDVVILATSILSTDKVLRSLPLQRLKRNTLFVDVLSVKEFPRSLFLQILPPKFDILCTHPMFGPESGKGSWKGLPFVYEKVRCSHARSNQERCDRYLDIFAMEGCRMVEMSCSEHDRHAAGSQFVTHTVGRVLAKLCLESTPINTKGYETLLQLVENTQGDSFDLYYGLYLYNVNANEQMKLLGRAFNDVQNQLIDQLTNARREALFVSPSSAHANAPPAAEPGLSLPPQPPPRPLLSAMSSLPGGGPALGNGSARVDSKDEVQFTQFSLPEEASSGGSGSGSESESNNGEQDSSEGPPASQSPPPESTSSPSGESSNGFAMSACSSPSRTAPADTPLER